ncbi:helix-turn-helix domain-containing protein [Porticoccaceae bacterium]|jgi:transcriptional regulator with XRE-family HTH domain|nr:helix-turn-helix domain-containing protein [Porticoccaceae bacterium]
MISVSQIKAGRSMLNWSAAELATASGTGPATIRRYEMQEGIPAGNTLTLVSIKSALESAGIEFTGDPLVNPGVTLRIKRDD